MTVPGSSSCTFKIDPVIDFGFGAPALKVGFRDNCPKDGYAATEYSISLGFVNNHPSHQRTRGLEFGLVNWGSGTFEGVQLGLVNISGIFRGLGIGVFMNAASRFQGVNISGFLNFTDVDISERPPGPPDIQGVQIAGFINYAEGKMEGVQLASLINFSEADMAGIQIALGNASDKSLKGLQLGLGYYATEADANWGIQMLLPFHIIFSFLYNRQRQNGELIPI